MTKLPDRSRSSSIETGGRGAVSMGAGGLGKARVGTRKGGLRKSG
jgi:hypothetical protein